MNIHNIFKVIVALVLSSGMLAQAAQPVRYYRNRPWNPNTREHLFGEVQECNVANCNQRHNSHLGIHTEIKDEGFRWRDSFNFSVGQNITEWTFDPVVNVNETELQPANNHQINLLTIGDIPPNPQQADYIHSYLSKIANAVQAQTAATNIAVAAITVVCEAAGNNNLIARSKVLSNADNKVQVAKTSGGINRTIQNVNFINYNAYDINLALNCIGANIPYNGAYYDGPYSCTEGQVIAHLTQRDFVLLKNEVKNLRNGMSVKLIILHVHTIMDPCAVCTRCLVGLSDYTRQNITTLEIDGVDQNTKFLVEVSSNDTYKPGRYWDNFSKYIGRNLSHAECAGHDGNEGTPININLNQPQHARDNQLAIPFGNSIRGNGRNWRLSSSFPPYVVFGIVNRDRRNNNTVGLSPKHNYLQCTEHVLRNVPPVQ